MFSVVEDMLALTITMLLITLVAHCEDNKMWWHMHGIVVKGVSLVL